MYVLETHYTMFTQCNTRNINEHNLSERTKAKMKGSSCKGDTKLPKYYWWGTKYWKRFSLFSSDIN